MPQITVRDPNRPDLPTDVLVSGGSERLPLDPAVRRRRLRLAGTVLLLGAVAVGGWELHDRRAQAMEDRRLGSVVDLRAEIEGASTTFDPAVDSGQLTLQVLLHNDGPRDVRVTAATLTGHDLLSGEVRLAAGRSAPLLLQRTVTCGTAPPETPAGGLRLAVRTASGGERAVELDLPADQDEAARLCGFRPLEAMHIGFGALARPSDEVVDLELELEARSVEPMSLVGLRPPPGVAVQPRVNGRPRGLPLGLHPVADRTLGLSVTLRFTVPDCAAALAPTGPDLPAPGEQASLLVQVADQHGVVSDALLAYPDRLLGSLLDASC